MRPIPSLFPGPPQTIERSPCLGEHTEEICKDILGMGAQEFDRLKAEGVFE